MQPTELLEMQQKYWMKSKSLTPKTNLLNVGPMSFPISLGITKRKPEKLATYARNRTLALASSVELEIQRLGMPSGQSTIELHADNSMNFSSNCYRTWGDSRNGFRR